MPAKVKVFSWRLLNNYLSTKYNLHARHITTDGVCPQCSAGSETLLHSFVKCSDVQQIWVQLGVVWPDMNTQDQFLDELERLSKCSSDDALNLRFIALWSIWSNRNQWVHERKKGSLESKVRFITSFLQEWNATKRCVQSIRLNREQACWEVPPLNWVKINFDASYFALSNKSGSGVVIRDHSGEIRAGIMASHGNVLNPCAEALACNLGVKHAYEMGLRDVIIKGDALTIIKKLKLTGVDRSLAGLLIAESRILLPQFRNVQIQHVFREANTLAHQVATRALHIHEPVYWYEEPSDYLSHLRI